MSKLEGQKPITKINLQILIKSQHKLTTNNIHKGFFTEKSLSAFQVQYPNVRYRLCNDIQRYKIFKTHVSKTM